RKSSNRDWRARSLQSWWPLTTRTPSDIRSEGMDWTLRPQSTDSPFFRMQELGIKPEHKVICFGQLYGMSDHIIFNLGNGGEGRCHPVLDLSDLLLISQANRATRCTSMCRTGRSTR